MAIETDAFVVVYFVASIIINVCILVGNSLTIIAILKKPKLATATNQFILGLALADLLVGFAMPYDFALFFIYYESDPVNSFGMFIIVCLLSIIPILLSCCASILHLIAIAVDRYVSIKYPLEHKVKLTKRRARYAVFCIWCLAVAISSVPLYWNNFNSSHMDRIVKVLPLEYVLFILLPAFFALMVVMLFTYTSIHYIAASRTASGRKSLKMVTLVLGCFCVCWLPYLVCLVSQLYDADVNKNTAVVSQELYYSCCYLLATSNSGMNPFIYAWKNQDFKSAFRELICCSKAPSAVAPAPTTTGSVKQTDVENKSLSGEMIIFKSTSQLTEMNAEDETITKSCAT